MAESQSSLILDIQTKEGHLTLSLHAASSSVHTLEDHPVNFDKIHRASQRIYRLIEQANELGHFNQSVNTELIRAGQDLFGLCVSKQVRDKLIHSAAEHLLIRLDDGLLAIPWELMHTGDDYLCLKFNVGRQVRTRKVYKQAHRPKDRAHLQLLVLADPCGNLPAAQEEMRQLRRQLEQRKDRLHVATKSSRITHSYVARNLHNYDIVHFAGHSQVDRHHPEASGWVLADGIWSIKDIQQLGDRDRQPALIFSNSCQSAFDHQDPTTPSAAEEISGIANAFILNGVRHFVGSLWKVPDDSAGTFAAQFYGELLKGSTIGSALKKARQQMAPASGSHQLTWANYILYGDPSTVMFGKQSRRWIRPLALIAVAVSLIGVLGHYHRNNSAEQEEATAARQFEKSILNEKDAIIKVIFQHKKVPKYVWEKFIERNEEILRTVDGRQFPDIKARILKHNGDLHIERGDYFLASVHYKKALSYLPENKTSYLFLRHIVLLDLLHAYVESGRLNPEAAQPLDEFKKSVKKHPNGFTDRQLAYLIRRFQLIRISLFKHGLKNSRFYKDLSSVYSDLKATRTNLR